MSAAPSVYSSHIGKKAAMAISGVIMVGWIFMHMLGNLQVYGGPEPINDYAHKLQSLGPVLWAMRAFMVAAMVVHVGSAVSLIRINRHARVSGYKGGLQTLNTTSSARSMRWGGLVLLLFLVFHLADLTNGAANPDFVYGDVHHNLIATFSNPGVAAFYIVAQVALGMHLFHGIWSVFQTLGFNHPKLDPWRMALARGVAAVVVVGNISIPVSVLAGLIS